MVSLKVYGRSDSNQHLPHTAGEDRLVSVPEPTQAPRVLSVEYALLTDVGLVHGSKSAQRSLCHLCFCCLSAQTQIQTKYTACIREATVHTT